VEGAKRATDLVQQIMTFSRKSDSEKRPLRIDLVLKEALELIRASIPSTILIEKSIISHTAVLGDPTQIHQVIMNLCTNAYHSMMGKGGTLGIKLDEITIPGTSKISGLKLLPGRYLKLEISDTGDGMEKATLEKIFDPYFTTKKSGKGTGLGLAIVLRIVNEHNGHINVVSEQGQGSIFELFFPITFHTASIS